MSSASTHVPDAITEQERKASQLHDLAESIALKCKQGRRNSSLETAIFLLRHALDQQSPSDLMRSETHYHLSAALLTRFHHRGWVEDLDGFDGFDGALRLMTTAIRQRVEAGNQIFGVLSESNADGQDQAFGHDSIQLARDMLTDFHQSVEHSSIDTAIYLYREALLLRPVVSPKRIFSLSALADALVVRFRITKQLEDLDEAIALSSEARDALPPLDPARYRLIRYHCACLCTRIARTCQMQDILHVAQLEMEAKKEDEKASNHFRSGIERRELFSQFGNISHLDGAVSDLYASLLLRPAPHPCRSISLNVLANALFTRFEQKDQLADLDESIGFHREALHLFPSPYPRRSGTLNNLAAMLWRRFEAKNELKDLEESIGFHREALNLFPADHPGRLASLTNFAKALRTQFEQKGQLADLDESIGFHREALHLIPAHHPDRSTSLHNLAAALSTRFQKTGQLADLVESVHFRRKVLALFPATHRHRSTSLDNLASALYMQFKQTDQLADLEECIGLFRETLDLRPAPDPDRSESLDNLALTLLRQFERKSQLVHLEESIGFSREALKLRPAPDPDRSKSLNNLGNALTMRFEQEGQLTDLEESIGFHREALDLRSAPHPDRSISLNNLALALLRRFKQKRQLADLEEHINLLREALDLFPSDQSTLSNLAVAHFTRFQETGANANLEESIKFHREALDLRPPSHPDRPVSLNDLGVALFRRFEQKGELADLEESIGFHQEALGLFHGHPDQPVSLNHLAIVLSARFEQNGQIADLEKSIHCLREALDLSPAPHPSRSMSLHSLANVLFRRFEQKGELADLEESVGFHREALDMFSALHPDRSASLNSLAIVLSVRFERKGQLIDLEESICFLQEALDLTPASHPGRPTSLDSLAHVLFRRFQQKRELADLKKSIGYLREALNLLAEEHPQRSGSLNNLASALFALFQETRQLADLEESIAIYQQSLCLLSKDHPRYSAIATNLGTDFMELYSITTLSTHLDAAMSTFRDAMTCTTDSVIQRFRSSRIWAEHADTSHHSTALEAYQQAIDLLPRLASLDMTLTARHEALSQASGLACDACAFAIRIEQFEKAVEFVSAGRAIFWSQALQLRTPLDNLELDEPELAGKLRRIANDLERASFRDVSQIRDRNSQNVRDMEKEASRCRELSEEWDRTLVDVRRREKYKHFLQPQPFRELQRATLNGPVVILNASKSRCDGLLIAQGSVHLVSLPALTLQVTRKLVVALQVALSSDSRSTDAIYDNFHDLVREMRTGYRQAFLVRDAYPDSEGQFRLVLEVLWLCVAKPVIQALHLQKSNSLTRLWWCPTGPFAFLPIHAAGIYEGEESTEELACLSDYAISSYIPTLEALLHPPLPTVHPFKVLIVIQPMTQGQPSLPFASKELEKIQQRVPKQCLIELGAKEAPTSVAQVLCQLSSASLAHFACHGTQNPVNPLESALLINNEKLKVSDFMKQRMPNASLAFLSACETAKGDEQNPDEVVHLSATMLFAGFRGVVGTMWSIADSDAPEVADVFYGHLFKNGQTSEPDINITESALALHLAVKKLCAEKKVKFSNWVPFVYLGV